MDSKEEQASNGQGLKPAADEDLRELGREDGKDKSRSESGDASESDDEDEGMGIKPPPPPPPGADKPPGGAAGTAASVLSVQTPAADTGPVGRHIIPVLPAKVQLDCPAQQLHVLGGMHQLLKEGQFCDVTVNVTGVEFPAHAIVLASASEYMRNALNRAQVPPPPLSPSSRRAGGSADAAPVQGDKLKISIDFDQRQPMMPAGFAAVLECLYNGKLVAEEELIPSILQLSTKLMLPAIRSACVAHLVSRVSESTMSQMLSLGEELGCSELIEASKAATRKRGSRLSNEMEGGGRTSEDGKGGTYTKVRGGRGRGHEPVDAQRGAG